MHICNMLPNMTTHTNVDLLIAGGEVLDPGAGIGGKLDVAIRAGHVLEIAANIDRARATQVIDASGQYVTPGLVDLHTHVYWGATFWGIEADPVAARSGVTTWLDVGSAGAYNFPGFRRYVREANHARVFALLNVSAIGLTAPTYELSNLDYCDIDLGARMIEANRDVILGVKARIDRNTTRGVGLKPLQLARDLADRVQLPLMVHIGMGPPTLDEILPMMKAGDILTHCFTGHDMRILNPHELIRDDVKRLHDQGVILDIGHGAGSFSFDTAEKALAQGVLPDVISSDIHQLSIQGPMFDMPVTLSKFLNLGMSLADVIERATARPAQAMRKPELGTIKPGSVADIALFRIEDGTYQFHDVHMALRYGRQLLVNTQTLVNGQVLPRLPERPLEMWSGLTGAQVGVRRPGAVDTN